MIPDIYRVVDSGGGFLSIMPRPGPGEWLEDEIRHLAEFGVTTLVSLLQKNEERELGIAEEGGIAAALGIDFVSFPIEDRSVPEDIDTFAVLVADLAQRVLAGQGVAIHCRAGIGRSGITAAGVLVRIGYEPAQVFERLTQARRTTVPDTFEQVQWFGRHHPRFAPDAPQP